MTRQLLRKLVVVPIALLLSAGAVASYRAYYPVRELAIELGGSALRPGTRLRVDTVSSGRGPVDVRLELIQGTRIEVLAVQRIRSRSWGFWDPRTVEHSLSTVAPSSVLEHFSDGPAVLHATATGARAWLRQPPPVVRDKNVEIRHD